MPQSDGGGGTDACREVVLLGAGFSHAVSGHFPLTRELGPLALGAAGVRDDQRPPEGTNFEAWLSRIGEDQPYRSAEENLGARQLFAKMSAAIGQVLGERQQRALQENAPLWLDDLVSVLHTRRPTVVSFNYDNVIECAVDGHCLTDYEPGLPRLVTNHDIVDRLPPLPPSILSEENPVYTTPFQDRAVPRQHPLWNAHQVARSFRLLKLHGSLSWYWSPDDTTGVTLQRWRSPGIFGEPLSEDEDERRRALPGRVPFIVPPTATKSSYLTNLVVREIWGRARSALAGAQRLIVIGYSVPPEDQVVSGMLAETLGGRSVEVVIADPCANVVKARLEDLGVAASAKRFDKQSCVEDFTAWYRDEQAARVVAGLRDWARSADLGPDGLKGQVHVEWGKCQRASCMATGPLGHTWQVDTAAITAVDDGKDVLVPLLPRRDKIDQGQVPGLLRLLSDNPAAERLVVQTTDKRTFPVVGYRVRPSGFRPDGTPSDPSRHLTLVPSGHPR
jgi:hypothetical protein